MPQDSLCWYKEPKGKHDKAKGREKRMSFPGLMLLYIPFCSNGKA